MTLAGMLRLLGEGLFLVMALLYTAMAVHLVSAARGKNWQLMASVELWSAADILFFLVALHKPIEYRHGLRVVRTFLPEQER
jgi:hypothetical protein